MQTDNRTSRHGCFTFGTDTVVSMYHNKLMLKSQGSSNLNAKVLNGSPQGSQTDKQANGQTGKYPPATQP